MARPFALAVAAAVTVVALAVAAPSGRAQISAFDWTLHYTPFQGQASQQGDVMHLSGPNNDDELVGPGATIWVSTVAPVAGHVTLAADYQSLDWDPHYDAPVVFIDGVITPPVSFQMYVSGTYAFAFDVEAGQSFGFGVWSADAAEGPGVADFRDLVFTPTTWADAGGAIDPRQWLTVEPPAGMSDFGASVAALGDLDGDGKPDVAVGAPASGHVRVLSGADGALLLEIAGPPGFGEVVSGAGDFDGDGRPDVLVGLPGDDGAGTDAGRAEVRSGLDGSLLFAVEGEDPGCLLGTAVALAGDMDGDGIDDILVGAPRQWPSVESGYVLLLGGPSGRLIRRFESGTVTFGSAVAALGDVNGDGARDIVAAQLSGSAHVMSGATGAILATAVDTIGGAAVRPALAPLADVDGDGRTDFVFGDQATSIVDFGAVLVCSGASGATLHQIGGTSFFDVLGGAVAGGDFDGDGVPDVAYRSYHLFDAYGRVRVASGASGFATIHELRVAPGDAYGAALAAVGDLDADGATDLALGAPGGLGLQLVHALDGNGEPQLSGTGDLSPGSTVSIGLVDGRGHAAALLVLSATRVDLPTKGGVLVPFPSALIPLPTNAAGAFTLSATWPPAIPGGFTLWMQVWMTDADGPWGFSASNGLGAETP